nr:MAG TPA: hypothetical protein [Caudoviricetes sp.]
MCWCIPLNNFNVLGAYMDIRTERMIKFSLKVLIMKNYN